MQHKKIVAVIDVGTLKSKFEIREFDNNLNSKVLFKDKQLTVLGKDLDKTNNIITKEAIAKTIDALIEFKSKIEAFQVIKYKAVTTEAVRKATNSNEVIRLIQEKTGIRLDVLSQEDEARILFKSVSKDFPDEIIAVSDIGGGSVQVVIGKDEKILELHLFKTGTYVLQERFSTTHHPTQAELKMAQSYVMDQLSPLIDSKYKPKYIIYGTTNIIEFLQTMGTNLKLRKNYLGDHPYIINSKSLIPLYEKITKLSYEERMPMYKKEPYFMWAADKALMNVLQICSNLKCHKVIPTNNNISSGILYELTEES